MKFLKGFTLGFFSFILFFLLVIFGIAYTVNQVALNPKYIVKVLNDIDFSAVIHDTIAEQGGGDMPPELRTAVIDAIKKTEPIIKERIGVALEDTYSYLKGRGSTPNLKETLGKSVMNSAFVADILKEIDLSQLTKQVLQEQTGTGAGLSPEFENALITSIDKLEPSLKQQIATASDPVFKYLLMQTSTIDLKTTMRQTILSDSFMKEVINSLDFKTLTKELLTEQIQAAQLPSGVALSSQQVDRIVGALEPSLKTSLANAAGPFADYLIGARKDFNVSISFAPAMPTVKTVVKEAYMANPPPEVRGLSQPEKDIAFELYYTNFQRTIPTAFNVNSQDLGIGMTDQVSRTITNAQDSLATARSGIDESARDFERGLREARPYVGLFRIGFICVIGLIVVLIMGIILLHRTVKGSCLNLGIIFFIYGVIEFAGLLIAKTIFVQQLSYQQNIPLSIQPVVQTVMNDVASPLQTVSLVCLIGGVLLIVTSFVYPRLRKQKAG